MSQTTRSETYEEAVKSFF